MRERKEKRKNRLKQLIDSIRKKGFTLIELIVVIAVLGILVLLAAPKFLGYNEEAFDVSVKADRKTVQTAVDMQITDNKGISPYKVAIGDIKSLDVSTLKPEFIGNLKQKEGYKFWIDGWDTVYYTDVNAPLNVNYEDGILSWNETEDADKYNIYKIADKKEVSLLGLIGIKNVMADSENRFNVEKKLYKTTEDLSIEVPEGTYLVSSVKKKGESAPVGEAFQGPSAEDNEESQSEPEKEIPQELLALEGDGNALIKINTDTIAGVQDGETIAKDNLTKAIELSKSGSGLFLESGDYHIESNDVFWTSPYKKYSNMVLRKSLTIVGEETSKTTLIVDDKNSKYRSDGQNFAITFNAPNITLKNMTIHVDQKNYRSLWSVFNIWGGWDGSTSKNLTLENITVIVDSPVDYLFYMNDYNLTVKNMKVISNGNIGQMFYWNYGNATIIDSSFDMQKGSGNVQYINTTFK